MLRAVVLDTTSNNDFLTLLVNGNGSNKMACCKRDEVSALHHMKFHWVLTCVIIFKKISVNVCWKKMTTFPGVNLRASLYQFSWFMEGSQERFLSPAQVNWLCECIWRLALNLIDAVRHARIIHTFKWYLIILLLLRPYRIFIGHQFEI